MHSTAELSVSLPERAGLFPVLPLEDASPLTAYTDFVAVCAEETGGTHALMPAVNKLHSRKIGTIAIAAGAGLQILQQRGHEFGLRLGGPMDDWPDARRPSALLITASLDGSLEDYLFSRFPGSPAIGIEDYPESGRRAIQGAAKLGLPPPTMCVLDKESERLIYNRFPGFNVPVEITLAHLHLMRSRVRIGQLYEPKVGVSWGYRPIKNL